MGQCFSILAMLHDRNISIFRRRAFKLTGNTLIKANYASVKQSRDSLHRDRHTVTKKVAPLKPLELRSSKISRRRVFLAHYYACKFGLNRLRVDGDIRKTALMGKLVIAMYR